MNYSIAKICLSILFSMVFGLASVAQQVITVVNNNDSGPGSLRDAITAANLISGPVNIHFNIPGTGPHIIQNSTTPLPGLGAQKVIDATTQPNYYLGIIELKAPSQNFGTGIAITGNESAVYGMKISNFGSGIRSNSTPVNSTFLIGDVNKGNHLYHNSIGIFISSINNPKAIIKGNLIEGPPAPFKGRAINLQTSDNIVGGILPGEGNIIKEHTEAFCNCNTIATNNIYRGNSASCNNSGITGSNGTTPTILSGNTQLISGVSTPNSTIDLYLYSNEDCPLNNTCQGYNYLSSIESASNGTWSIQLAPGMLQGGSIVSATNTQSGKSTSNFSSCFTVASAPSTPECTQLQLPQPGSTDVTPIMTFFFWSPIADSDGYIVNIGTAPDNFDLVSDSIVLQNSLDLNNIDLPFDTVIFVKITPYNSFGSSENCTVFSFNTAAQCPSGDLTLSSQQEVYEFVTAFPFCSIIDGDVNISGSDIIDLSVLNNIQQINGSLLIENNPLLTNLNGLDQLSTVNGNLRLSGNLLLTGISSLGNLSHLGYSLTLDSNPALLSLNGLEGIFAINDALTIYDCVSLNSLHGLNQINSIHGQLYIGYNDGLVNLEGIDALQSSGQLAIYNNDALQSLDGLNSLTILNWGGIDITENQSLQNIDALSNLQAVTGEIYIRNTAIETLDALANISPDNIWNLTITDNAFLQTCHSTFICDYLNDLNKAYDINNNDVGCNSIVEILAACGGEPCSIPAGYLFTSQEDVDSFPAMFPGCKSINGDIYLIGNSTEIWNLDSLIQLEEIHGQLTVGSTLLTDLTGLNNLKSVDYLYIAYNNELKSLQGLNNLDSLPFGINLTFNDSITSLEGLNGLITMGSLDIRYNSSLVDLSGLEQLTDIFGYIGITNNASLQSLHGIDDVHFENTPFGSPHLFIYDNPLLEICGVPSICDFLERPGKIVSIYNNAEGCNSRTEVEESCVPEECTISCPDQIIRCMSEGAFQIQGATPAGGTFSGAGIIGDMFDPAIAGPGIHIIEFQVNTPSCTGSCTFSIEVQSDPAIMDCPNGTVQLDWSDGTCGAIALYDIVLGGYPSPDVNYQITGATQANGQGSGTGSYLNIGINQIQITATNECNTAICSFEINVIDQVEPEVTCPDQMVLVLDENCQAVVPNYFEFASYSDNCPDQLSLSQFPEVGSVVSGFANESLHFILDVIDLSDNYTYCSFDVLLVSDQNESFDVFGFDEIIVNQSQTPNTNNGTEFGATYLYEPITHEFEVINNSCSEISLGGTNSAIGITGANSNRFAVIETIPEILLMPGETTVFSIMYDAAEEGLHEAQVVIETELFTHQFAIAGSTANVQMVVRGNGIPIENGSTEPSLSNLTDFGTVNSNSSRSRTFTIHNLRASPLHLIGSPRVQIIGDHADMFTVTLQPLSPVQSIQRQFSIRFNASGVGTFSATVVIENNDPTKNPYTFNIAAFVPIPNMRITGNNLTIENGSEEPSSSNLTDFGVRNVNSNTIHSFVVRNNPGSGLLVLTGNPRAIITGPNANMFTVVTQPVMNISSGGASLLRIRYTPLNQGVHYATVEIPSNDPNKNPYTFAIKGATPNALSYINPILQEESILNIIEPITVYPNPFQNSFILTAPTLEKTTKLLMLDLGGREVGTFNLNQGENSYEVPDLPAGTYHLLFPDLDLNPITIIKQ